MENLSTVTSNVQLVPKRIYYNLEFQPDLDFLSNEEIVEYCLKALATLAADRDNAVEKLG